MEPHPVPQNIIDVEFKLFGSFTLKQFSKILVGCLIGVGIFFININPIIKFPIIFLIVVLGFGLAIVPNLGIWMIGFIKTIFVSPRYVWSKRPTIPELLAPDTNKKQVVNDRSVAVMTKQNLDIHEMPPQSQSRYDIFEEKPQDTNDLFFKVYEGIYGQNALASRNNPFGNKVVVSSPVKKTESSTSPAQFLSRAVQSIDINIIKPKPKQLQTKEDYIAELERLRNEFESLDKGASDYQQRSQVLIGTMNNIYAEYKIKVGVDTHAALGPDVSQTAAVKSGKVINGIVVSKNNEPVPNAEIYLTNLFYSKTYKTVSLQNGRFSTNIPIPQGDYDIRVAKYGAKFHTYKIKISDQKPPAFKFREK